MFAVIYIPDFHLQAALRHEPELFLKPVALLHDEIKALFQLTSVARAAGVCEGLTPTQALARCSNVLLRTRSIPQESAAMNVLIECAYAFSPNIEATAPGVCTLDLKGLSLPLPAKHEWEEGRGEGLTLNIWAEKILQQLASLNLRAQIGIAENPDLALHAAKIARPVFFVENSSEFVSSLPIESIEPPREILEILQRWGIRTLGEFIALGKDKLVERFGSEALVLFDRAAAKEIRPLNLARPAEVFEESTELEHEIETLEPLLFILRRFIEQLSRRLELFYLVAEEIQLRLALASGEKYERSFRVPSPTRNIETLFRMLQTHLENVRTESPIVSLHLVARPGRSEQFQFGLFETALRDPNQFYETLAQLTSLLGTDCVGTPILENTHRPDAFRMAPVNFETERNFELHTSNFGLRLPLRRFRPPLPVIVEFRNGKPVLLHSELFVGAIAKAKGPFRSSGDWWEQEKLWNRDEWEIETTSGELFRIFTENHEWFLEGVFD